MNREMWRYLRQIQILGEAEQRAVMAGRAEIAGDDLSALTAALYLAGSGIGTLAVDPAIAVHARALNRDIAVVDRDRPVPPEPLEALDHGDGLTDETARAVASGAIRALAALAVLAVPAAGR